MGETITCFWATDTGDAKVSLRRYRSDCPSGDYCNESVDIGRFPQRKDEKGYLLSIPPAEFDGDPRWPVACPRCKVDFGPLTELNAVGSSDVKVHTHVNQEPIYRAEDGREWEQRSLPPGAMFDAFWARHWGVGADGISLTVVVPYPTEDARSGFWNVDGPATGQPDGKLKPHAWTRTGDPRVPGSVSANPSILTSNYHGFLRSGTLQSV